jgi:DnaJ-class molecular chaperone
MAKKKVKKVEEQIKEVEVVEVTEEVKVPVFTGCKDCNGSGLKNDHQLCPKCQGTGQ